MPEGWPDHARAGAGHLEPRALGGETLSRAWHTCCSRGLGMAQAPIGFHVTFRLTDDRPIATTVADYRRLARVVIAQGDPRGLLAFGAADNHLHAELACDRATAGDFAQYVATSLRWQLRLKAPFEVARIRPLVDQRHAYNTFHYVLRQDVRHELGRDPAREATSLPDLLGMRVLPGSLARRVRALLPRIQRADLLVHFEDAPSRSLAEAACAAFALPDLRGLDTDTRRARHAAVHAAGPVATRDLAEQLMLSLRAIQAFRAKPADPAAVHAVVLQQRLR